MRRNFTLKVSAFVLGLTLAITEGCIFNDCIYFATYGYRSCGRLNPVESQTSQGPVMIETAEGEVPSGCICVTEEEKTLLGSDPSSSELDVVYVKLQAQAQTNCIALAEELGADTAPCMTATLSKGSVVTANEISKACWYIYDSTDHEKCPLEEANDDDAGTSDSSDSDSSESGRPLPDLPGDKLP